MKWNIITDSSCDLYDLETKNKEIAFSNIPFTISLGNRDFIDDDDLDVRKMVAVMEESEDVSRSACPSPELWYEQFKKSDYSIAITISSGLSGSYNSANTARSMILEEYPDKKIAVIDSRSAGAEISLMITRLCRIIEAGYDFEHVVKILEMEMQYSHIIFALSSFDNLVKNGRMSKLTGFIARKLGFWGIGIGSEQGTISIKEKVRGNKRAVKAILEDINERGSNVETVFISHCENEKFAENLKDTIQNVWTKLEVKIMPTRGLCSYYAEKGGVIVGF